VKHFKIERDAIEGANLARTSTHFSLCQALVSVRYYMRFLAEEYQRDVNSNAIKSVLVDFFANPATINALSSQINAQVYMSEMI
jgi:hypothetical protein